MAFRTASMLQLGGNYLPQSRDSAIVHKKKQTPSPLHKTNDPAYLKDVELLKPLSRQVERSTPDELLPPKCICGFSSITLN
jgi:hypothetical protein